MLMSEATSQCHVCQQMVPKRTAASHQQKLAMSKLSTGEQNVKQQSASKPTTKPRSTFSSNVNSQSSSIVNSQTSIARSTSSSPQKSKNTLAKDPSDPSVDSLYTDTQTYNTQKQLANPQRQPKPQEEPQEYADEGPRHPCSICNRKFADLDRLDKHYQACQKSQKPRKAFDMQKARVKGTDLEQFAKSPAGLKSKNQKEEELPKKNWKVKHDRFLQQVRVGKGDNSGPPLPNDDLVQCEHCSRKFNEDSAAKHIPICRDIKQKEMYRTNNKNAAAAKETTYQTRMKYKPPVPRTKDVSAPASKQASPTRR